MFSYLQSACWLLALGAVAGLQAGTVPWVTRSPGPASLTPSLRKVHFRTRRGCLRPSCISRKRARPATTLDDWGTWGHCPASVHPALVGTHFHLLHRMVHQACSLFQKRKDSQDRRQLPGHPTGLVGSVCSRCVWLLGALLLTHPLLCRCAIAHPSLCRHPHRGPGCPCPMVSSRSQHAVGHLLLSICIHILETAATACSNSAAAAGRDCPRAHIAALPGCSRLWRGSVVGG